MYNLTKIILSIIKRPKVYVFGDSHTLVFDWINKYHENKFIVTRVDGATALGMVNPNSKTNALPKFLETINTLSKKSNLLFLLGEVDVGFLLWYRKESLNNDIEVDVTKSIENYITFLSNLKQQGFINITVFSPPPPCITDEFKLTQTVELRRNINASLKERTELAIEYNKKIEQKLKKEGINFINLYDDLIDTNTGIIKTIYLNQNRTDHHLDNNHFAKLISSKLNL